MKGAPMLLMSHPKHGYHWANGQLEEANMRRNGWTEAQPATPVAPAVEAVPDTPAPIEPKRRGRPPKVKQ